MTDNTTTSAEASAAAAAAAAAAAHRFKSYLSSLPPLQYPSHYSVQCVRGKEEANRKLERLLEEESVFGVDLEWPPTFKKNQPEKKTALVQICSSKTILLIQLSAMSGLPEQLRLFLENRDILKTGVDIASDGKKLIRDFGVQTNGLVDLRILVKNVKSPQLQLSHLRSLSALTGMFLNQKMAKGKVRTSNWAKPVLTPQQIKYASLDAYASYQLFHTLKDLVDPNLPLPIQHLSTAKK